jgi:hypothetical protein
MSSTGERRGVSFHSLAWVAVSFIALACAGAWVAYRHLIHYRRCAVEHLPAETDFAARLDVEQVVLFDPVRRHLLPLIDRLPLATQRETEAAVPAPDRLTRLRQEAGLNLGLDLREVLFATSSDRRWVLVLGGLFPHALLPALERTLQSEAAAGWTRVGDRLEFAATGAALGQAADGTLILASDRAALEAALPSSQRYRALGLSREGAGGARVSRAALGAWAAGSVSPWLDGVESVGLSLRLVREIEIDAQVEARDEAAARALTALVERRPVLSNPLMDRDLRAGSLDPWGLLARVQSIEASGTTVKFVSFWRQSELDRTARELAAWLQRRLSAATPSPS